jgi:hypothetical protein
MKEQSSTITSARITPVAKKFGDPLPIVFVTVDGKEQRLFEYYSDELSFLPQDFVGLTVEQGHDLKHKRDVAYLQS